MADYCSLDDAFPASLAAAPGCRGSSAPIAQSKEERRKAKRCKGPLAAYLSDSDRPSLATPLNDEQAMRGSGAVNPYNPETGLYQNGPLGVNPVIGQAQGPSGQAVDELFVRAPASAYTERKAPPSPSSNTKLVETPGPARLYSSQQKPPAYFGAGEDDEGFVPSGRAPRHLENDEGFANYIPASAGTKDEYMLSPDFSKTFGARGVDRATGEALPVPSIVDAWKKITPAGARSAIFDVLPEPGGEYIIGRQGGGDMKQKLDQIFARLDDLESDRNGSESNQMEIFLFILSGMFVMFAVDAFARKR